MSKIKEQALIAKQASRKLATLTTAQKNEALLQMANALTQHEAEIIAANKHDLERGQKNGLTSALLDRLALDSARIASMAEGLSQIAKLDDPVGEELESFTRPNGMHITKIRVPIGLVGMIYEARPNVTVDAAGLCLKTGNAVLLRGGSAALSSNEAIIRILHKGLEQSDLPKEALQLVADADRSSAQEMLKLHGILDVIIPRGGASLIKNVIENSTVPVIETGAGICHTYIDDSAEPTMAKEIIINAKVQRPSVCNAMETLVMHSSFAANHLGEIAAELKELGVQLKGNDKSLSLVPDIQLATDEDFSTEYNDYILNIKVVDSLDEAIEHVQKFSTLHSECIVTETAAHAERYLQEIDASSVFHNVSTRFTDGFEFGFGAEIGISTQKLHARGPMGLPALTTNKYIIKGNGQIRN